MRLGEGRLGVLGVLPYLRECFVVLLRTLGECLSDLSLGCHPGLAERALELFRGTGFHLRDLRGLRPFRLAACLFNPVGHFLLQLGQLALGLLRLGTQLGECVVVLLRGGGECVAQLSLRRRAGLAHCCLKLLSGLCLCFGELLGVGTIGFATCLVDPVR